MLMHMAIERIKDNYVFSNFSIYQETTNVYNTCFFSQNIWYIEGYGALYMTPFAMRQPGNMLLKAGTMFFHLKMILLAALA